VWDYEIARCLADEYSRHRDRIGDDARTLACAHWVQLSEARRF
jgi:hypothetical protein